VTAPLLFVPPEALWEVWPKVCQHIVDIHDACDEPWGIDEMFGELVAGKSFLWAVADLSGFLVVQMLEGKHERVLHCWICYNRSGEPPIAYWPDLQRIAREHGCSRITFENDRPGFQRHIPGLRMRYLYSAAVPGEDDGREEDHHQQ
jgi:hypothetical protein